MLAAVRGQLPTVRALVARGKADPAATDCLGRTAADLAELEGHTNIVNWLRRCAVLPPLHRACDLRAGERDIAELLRRGADPFLRSAAGETPLQICRHADAALGALPARKETTDVIAAAVKLKPEAVAPEAPPRALPAHVHAARGAGAACTAAAGPAGGAV